MTEDDNHSYNDGNHSTLSIPGRPETLPASFWDGIDGEQEAKLKRGASIVSAGYTIRLAAKRSKICKELLARYCEHVGKLSKRQRERKK